MRVVENGGIAYVFIDWRQYVTKVTAWESAGWTLKNVVVWDKAKAGGLGAYWRNNHEWICVFAKGRANWVKGSGQYNTWTGPKKRGGLHPTEKPVELLTFLQNGVAARGGVILDPFAGSCSTGVAALTGGFSFIGIERDARYINYGRDNLLRVGGASCPIH
jgi:site-specific DNA-methyltransferase (adenine-specific)